MSANPKSARFSVKFLPKNIRLADRKNLVRRRGFDRDGKTIPWNYGQERELIISELDILGRDFSMNKKEKLPYIWAPRALRPANLITSKGDGNLPGFPDYDFELTLVEILRQTGEKDKDLEEESEIESPAEVEPALEE